SSAMHARASTTMVWMTFPASLLAWPSQTLSPRAVTVQNQLPITPVAMAMTSPSLVPSTTLRLSTISATLSHTPQVPLYCWITVAMRRLPMWKMMLTTGMVAAWWYNAPSAVWLTPQPMTASVLMWAWLSKSTAIASSFRG